MWLILIIRKTCHTPILSSWILFLFYDCSVCSYKSTKKNRAENIARIVFLCVDLLLCCENASPVVIIYQDMCFSIMEPTFRKQKFRTSIIFSFSFVLPPTSSSFSLNLSGIEFKRLRKSFCSASMYCAVRQQDICRYLLIIAFDEVPVCGCVTLLSTISSFQA